MKHKFFLILNIFEALIIFLILSFDFFFYNNLNISDANGNINDHNIAYNLNGEWEFYENQSIATDNSLGEYRLVNFPISFLIQRNMQGSYRLTISNIDNNKNLSLQINNIYGDTKVYINRTLLLEKKDYCNQSLNIDKELIDDSLEIIIEVKNNDNLKAYLSSSPFIRDVDSFRAKQIILSSLFLFTFIGLIIFIILDVVCHAFYEYKKSNILLISISILTVINMVFSKNASFSIFANYLSFNPKIYVLSNMICSYLTALLLYYFANSLITNKKHKINFLDLLFAIVTIVIVVLSFILDFNSLLLTSNCTLIFSLLVLIITLVICIANTKQINLNNYSFITVLYITIAFTIDLLSNLRITKYSVVELIPVIILTRSLSYLIINMQRNKLEVSEVKEISDLKEKIRDTEFNFLNSQIQSHFIYNTLNSIQALCYKNPRKAALLIEDFSNYLRSRLEFNKMPQLIDVIDELENTKTYLNIEKERFGDRIKFKFDLNVADFKIPPLSIQPLVENAVKHGISKKPGGGTITVKTYEDENNIYINVIDDGVGFDPASITNNKRVGTENIKHRLNLHLNASLKINSKVGVGTVSTITIPK